MRPLLLFSLLLSLTQTSYTTASASPPSSSSSFTEVSSKLLWSTLLSTFEVHEPIQIPLVDAAISAYTHFIPKSNPNSDAILGDQFYLAQVSPQGTNKVFQQDPTFTQLKETMAEVFSYTLQQFFNVQPTKQQLDGLFCWATVGGGPNPESQTFHPPHTHKNSVLSAVYYASIPTPSAPITFQDPRGSWTSQIHAHQPQNNTIVVFPSWLEHYIGVTPSSPQYRISYSCNLPGSHHTTTDLNIEL
ncbi:hypothetical protein TrLO_g13061 [Triparma laevis f. longispina]|uniref:Prolyl 4-hydroxylase alpha subunit Fe(2+) 2OG dioxygenase domain-containing protein n=1 Tax=Triparma laevis f. longispina TaxID=1714387 RepID=A0A9W7FLJ3_9STRA|nr:hypothetical protein TrLO_g13061 [Triparma laevis f. longispina]